LYILQVHDEKIPLSADENGVLHIGRTRVTLDSIVGMFEAGASAEQIADEYDSLTLDEVYGVIFFYLRHQDQVKDHLAREERESEEASKRFEARFPNHLREKLVRARQARDSGGG
jgi:uncharacterized protein (DUF433 family)